jgi:DNA polymerase I-like protein with 3'-5' exonuclease and polymerase domains
VDKSQAESYCTGYISQDVNLIHTVTTSPDFHCQNASMFFGIPFEELYDVVKSKKLNKGIRDIAKRVNHGANYNMGWQVLWETMGTREVLRAKQLLKLPIAWTIRKVCEYLLACFDRAYPKVRKDWYNSIVLEVFRTGMLVTPSGYTRRTFLQPQKSKPDLNAAVAHKPQSLSSELVEQAFVRIYHELQLGKYAGKFRLKAPVHDEIIFIATPDIIDQALDDVANMMVIPIEIHGRVMTIPSTKESGLFWSDLKG